MTFQENRRPAGVSVEYRQDAPLPGAERRAAAVGRRRHVGGRHPRGRIMTNQRFTCDDTETLVAYLYDELDAEPARGGRRGTSPPARPAPTRSRRSAACGACSASGPRRRRRCGSRRCPMPVRVSAAVDVGAGRPCRRGRSWWPRRWPWPSAPRWPTSGAPRRRRLDADHRVDGSGNRRGAPPRPPPTPATPGARRSPPSNSRCAASSPPSAASQRPGRGAGRAPTRRALAASAPDPGERAPAAAGTGAARWRSSAATSTCSAAPTWCASTRASASSRDAPAPPWPVSARCSTTSFVPGSGPSSDRRGSADA